MKLLIYSSFFLLFADFCQSQCTVTTYDSLNKKTIPFAHILTDDGVILGITNQNGQFQINAELDITKESRINLVFQHIGYQTKSINVNIMDEAIDVYLGPVQLKEIYVTGSRLNNNNEYLVLNGFFRSYQIEDSIPKYYSDGFVRYYVRTHSNKLKLVPVEVIEHRTFQNYALVEKDKARTFNVRQESFGPPFFRERSTLKNLETAFDLSKQSAELIHVLDETKLIGQIRYDSSTDKTLVDVDVNLKNRLKVRKAFGYQSIFEREISSEIYSGNYAYNHTGSYEGLERSSVYRKLHFKHKSEKNYRIIEWVHEFYTTKIAYISKSEFSNLNLVEYEEVKYSSNFGIVYEEKKDNLDLPKLPKFIEVSLEDGSLTRIDQLLCNTCD